MYNQAQIVVNEPVGDGRTYRCVLLYIGDAGEKTEDHLILTPEEATDIEHISDIARQAVAQLNRIRGKALPASTILDLSVSAVPLSDKQLFFRDRNKAERLKTFLLNAEANQLNELLASLNKRYLPEYFDEV